MQLQNTKSMLKSALFVFLAVLGIAGALQTAIAGDDAVLQPVPTFLILGQSNADGMVANAELSPELVRFYAAQKDNLKIYYKPAVRDIENRVMAASFVDDGAWYSLGVSHDDTAKTTHMNIGNPNQSVAIGTNTYHGVELALAAKYFAAHPDQELRIIKVAVAGSSIEQDWGVTGRTKGKVYDFFLNYTYLPAVAKMALEGKRPEIIGVFWMQGESNIGQSTYGASLQTFVDNLNTDLGVPLNKIIIGGLSSAAIGADADALKQAQADVALANKNTAILKTDGSDGLPAIPLLADNIHFTSAGYETIADRILDLL